MVVCSSCKNKTSSERCTNKALVNFTFCKTHMKSKNPRLWSVVNNIEPNVIKIQKVWKGYRVRNWIKLAGPGVMKPSIRNNTEDMFSMEERVHPLDYFGFEEEGKVYWFEIKTFLHYLMTVEELNNPYTRKELTIETRKRARSLYIRRRLHKLPVSCNNEEKSILEKTTANWRIISQILEENGFSDVNSLLFESLNNVQLYILTTMISNDVKAWAAEHTNIQSQRFKFFHWLTKLSTFVHSNDRISSSYSTAKVLLTILHDSVEPYSLCFIIVSALYRL
jgi:hypothetical protein